MKKVLFLAPNYKYIHTTVTGITKELMRHKIQFTTNVPLHLGEFGKPKEKDDLYLRTSEVEVIFNHDDPISWTASMMFGVNAFYGKKELLEQLQENFFDRVVNKPKQSLTRFIIETNQRASVTQEDTPAKTQYIPDIAKVYFNNPMTVVLWSDGTKTMVKCQPGDLYSEETGLALCISKKAFGNKGNFNEVFKKWVPETKTVVITSSLPYDDPPMLTSILDSITKKMNRRFYNND